MDAPPDGNFFKTYELPDGVMITVGVKRFRCAEVESTSHLSEATWNVTFTSARICTSLTCCQAANLHVSLLDPGFFNVCDYGYFYAPSVLDRTGLDLQRMFDCRTERTLRLRPGLNGLDRSFITSELLFAFVMILAV